MDSKSDVLQYVERDIDSDADEKFDELIVGNIERLESYGIKIMEKPSLFLSQIVSRDRSLDQAYKDYSPAENLVNGHPALVLLLTEAYETKSFAKVRSLAILQRKPRDVEELWKTSNVSRIPYDFGIITSDEHASLDKEVSAITHIGSDPAGILYIIILTARHRGWNLKPLDYNHT